MQHTKVINREVGENSGNTFKHRKPLGMESL